MIDEERKAKATAIVAEVLELLASKNLTISDAQRILSAATHAMLAPSYRWEETTVVSVNGEIDWKYATLPELISETVEP